MTSLFQYIVELYNGRNNFHLILTGKKDMRNGRLLSLLSFPGIFRGPDLEASSSSKIGNRIEQL